MVRARSLARTALAAALSIGGVAAAQTPADSAPRRLAVNASALRPGQFVYQLTVERDAGTTIIGTRTVTLAQTTYVGSPAWLITDIRSMDNAVISDSLFTDPSLRPLHWGATSFGGAHLAAEFRGDSAFGATSAPPGRRSMISSLPPGTLVTWGMTETVLRLLPLRATWEDSAAVISATLGSNTTLPARLAVIGEDRVRVPAGTFDCWVVAMHTDSSRGLYWVTQRDPIVVRAALDLPTLGGAQLVSALTRITR